MLNPEEQAEYDALGEEKREVTARLRQINAARRTLYNRGVARAWREKNRPSNAKTI